MGYNSGSVYIFVRRDNVTSDEVKKLSTTYGESHYWFGFSVDVSINTAIIGSNGVNEMVHL